MATINHHTNVGWEWAAREEGIMPTANVSMMKLARSNGPWLPS